MNDWTKVATWSELPDREPAHALVEGVDLVVVRHDDRVSVLYGRCLHRGALLADGYVEGQNLICGLHHWDYRYDTGVSEYDNSEALEPFPARVDPDGDQVLVDAAAVRSWAREHPQPWDREAYLGPYQDVHGTPEEPANAYIQRLAREGLTVLGHHGRVEAMGVPGPRLPSWDDIQILTAQLATRPLADDAEVGTDVSLGPAAARPLRLEIPLLVSDMSFGALSLEAKVALARGAESAGTGICSGEGGMLPEEQAANSRYLYELASGKFGWALEKVAQVQAFHFKAGQGAKTGTGGHLPGRKVTERIAEVRGLQAGEDAVSPSRFADLATPGEFRAVANQVREASGGIPIGFKISAQHIEADLDFCIEAGADYVIVDGRGGGTGAAPLIFRDHISVPTLAALARARRHHGGAPHRDRLREGAGAGRRRRGHRQLGHAGHRVPGHAGLPDGQLSRGDRHAEGPPPLAARSGGLGTASHQLPGGQRRPHEGPGSGLRPRPPLRLPTGGSYLVAPGDLGPDGNPVRRGRFVTRAHARSEAGRPTGVAP